MKHTVIPQVESLPIRVLVVTGDPILLADVQTALESAGVQIRDTPDTGALAATVSWKPDIAIADVDMLRVDAVDVLRSIRPDLPVIALTRESEVSARVRAFEHGADDALGVPFATEELLARYTALLRRARTGLPHIGVVQVHGLEIDLLRRRARLAGVDLRLTPVEQSLLYLLASNAGRILSRDQILDAVWGEQNSADSNIVDRHIRNLRSKLHEDWRNPTFIVTVSGQGYAFRVPDVQAAPGGSAHGYGGTESGTLPIRLAWAWPPGAEVGCSYGVDELAS
jgi:DNA-binding response OmpR family regulator